MHILIDLFHTRAVYGFRCIKKGGRKMIYPELFLTFLNVGFFSFGGAYGALPLIRDVVLSHGWLNDEMLMTMLAVNESTPGPVMINLATYVGSTQAGLPGAAVTTLAVVLPSFFVIVLILILLSALWQNPYLIKI